MLELDDAIDRILELECRIDDMKYERQWIPVAQAMPGKRESTQYLVLRDNGPYRLHYDVAVCDLVCRWWNTSGVELHDVTHWQPLPAPPEVEL